VIAPPLFFPFSLGRGAPGSHRLPGGPIDLGEDQSSGQRPADQTCTQAGRSG